MKVSWMKLLKNIENSSKALAALLVAQLEAATLLPMSIPTTLVADTSLPESLGILGSAELRCLRPLPISSWTFKICLVMINLAKLWSG